MTNLNLTIKQLNELNLKIPNKKNNKVSVKEQKATIYSRTYKGILFYEMSLDGVPFVRYFMNNDKINVCKSVYSYMYGWWPENKVFKHTYSERFKPNGSSYYNIFRIFNIKETKSIIHKDDLRNYIDTNIVELLFYEDHKTLETAYKEGWISIYRNHRFDRYAKTIPEQWGLPRFSKSEIHRLKSFITPEDYHLYLDYVNTAIKVRKKFNSSSYFIKTWKQAHNRDIDKINKQREYDRHLASMYKKRLKSRLYKVQFNDIHKLPNPKTNKDLEVLGKELRNCIVTYKPEEIRIFIIKSMNEKIAVEWVDNEVKQARVIDNMDIPNKIKKHIAEVLRKEEQHGKVQNA